jgi:hypothetical protein
MPFDSISEQSQSYTQHQSISFSNQPVTTNITVMPADKALCLTIISGKPDDVSAEDWEKHVDDEVTLMSQVLNDPRC